MAVSLFAARSSSRMALPLEAMAGEVAMSTVFPTNILPPSHLSCREYGATPADRERERGNMDAQVHQPSYEYPWARLCASFRTMIRGVRRTSGKLRKKHTPCSIGDNAGHSGRNVVGTLPDLRRRQHRPFRIQASRAEYLARRARDALREEAPAR
jgi:hypothetical protein